MRQKKNKTQPKQPKADKKKTLTADEIIAMMDGELVVDETEESIPLPEQTLFDDDVLSDNITIFGVKRLGERETKFGVTTDYLLSCKRTGTTDKFNIRTNHAYVFGVIYRLDKYKRPIDCRILKSKGGRYFIAAQLTQ